MSDCDLSFEETKAIFDRVCLEINFIEEDFKQSGYSSAALLIMCAVKRLEKMGHSKDDAIYEAKKIVRIMTEQSGAVH